MTKGRRRDRRISEWVDLFVAYESWRKEHIWQRQKVSRVQHCDIPRVQLSRDAILLLQAEAVEGWTTDRARSEETHWAEINNELLSSFVTIGSKLERTLHTVEFKNKLTWHKGFQGVKSLDMREAERGRDSARVVCNCARPWKP